MKISNLFKSFLVGLPIGVTILDSVGYVARVDGISMQPVLNPDKNQTDYVFLNKWAVKSYEIKRGDIIALISPKDPSQNIIKRVVAVPGDIIGTLGYKNDVVKIPEGHCWVEGDHTGHSMDSNNFGPVSIELNMRAISLVNHINLEFPGNVANGAICLGDVDNDGCNELIIGNENGLLTIFKGRDKFQVLTNLGFITCLTVGDILNQQKNNLVVITADGWCYIYETPEITEDVSGLSEKSEDTDKVDGSVVSAESEHQESESSIILPLPETDKKKEKIKKRVRYKDEIEEEIKEEKEEDPTHNLVQIHLQRIPANVKHILLADVDGDGLIEMVIALTDRVVRSYRWVTDSYNSSVSEADEVAEKTEKITGKLVALHKWECAKQIGSISINHGLDGKPSLLVAQPGGTFMRIRCHSEDLIIEGINLDDSSSSQSESLAESLIEYQTLRVSQMRNQNISTEILGDFKLNQDLVCKSPDSQASATNSQASANVSQASVNISQSSINISQASFPDSQASAPESQASAPDSQTSATDSQSSATDLQAPCKTIAKENPYALATLDGTIMFIQDEVILWSVTFDQQTFALSKMDITGNGADDLVVCTWDGDVYIMDPQKNCVRFSLNQSVQAFTSGYYSVSPTEPSYTSFVFNTFKNTIVIYYDILLSDLVIRKFEPDLEALNTLFLKDRSPEEAGKFVKGLDAKSRGRLIEYLLYDVEL